jgi:undecaprenyl-diphosphatase
MGLAGTMQRLRYLLRRASRVEKRTLAGIVIVAVLVLTFAVLADAVTDGNTQSFDERLLLLFRTASDPAVTIGPIWFKEAMRDITALGGTVVLTIIILSVTGFLIATGARHTALMVLASVVSGVMLSNSLKFGFSRVRPDIVPHEAQVYTASFPSGHTTMSAIVYLTLGALLCRTQASVAVKTFILSVAVFLTIIVGVSRVYLGVHWPTDVIAGWMLGGAWALLCWFTMLWLQSRGDVEQERRE